MSKTFQKTKDYKFSIKLYPDCVEYDCEEVLENLKGLFSEWCYILHDKDNRSFSKKVVKPLSVNFQNYLFQVRTRYCVRGKGKHTKKAHYHFYGRNNHNLQISLVTLIRTLSIPYKYAHNRDFEYASNWQSCILYSIHKNAPDKFQYSFRELKTNIPNLHARYLSDIDISRELDIVMQYIEDSFSRQNGKGLTYFELVRLCNQKGLSIHFKHSVLLKNLLYSYRNPDII